MEKKSAKPHRIYGVVEERFFPREFAHQRDKSNYDPKEKDLRSLKRSMRDVKFYHNRVTGRCSWEQPADWRHADRVHKGDCRERGVAQAFRTKVGIQRQ